MTLSAQPLSSELRVGQIYQQRAFVVSTYTFGEGHMWVELLCEDHNKRIAFARNAARSKKRFGACLDLGTEVKATYKCSQLNTEGPSWFLEQLDLIEGAFDLRASYSKLKAAFFVSAFGKELLPSGSLDSFFFPLYSSLYATLKSASKTLSSFDWVLLAFWSIAYEKMGYGDFYSSQKNQLFKEDQDQVDFQSLLRDFSVYEKTRLSQKRFPQEQWPLLYLKWKAQTQHTWKYFEKEYCQQRSFRGYVK